MMVDIKKEVNAAYDRIKSYVRETTLDHSLALSKKSGCHVFLKCENLQFTGSFKTRGAFNKLLSLSLDEREKGIVTASTGNHGAAVAFGLYNLKIPGTIFVPENASKTKVANIQLYDVPLKYYGNDCVVTENYARKYGRENNQTYISPYNDLQVLAGQGTIAIELKKQLSKIDALFAPIGGGGLIAGIGGYLKETANNTKIIGCLPENSPVMYESIQQGKIIDMETTATLSDATAGGIEAESITFELCQRYVDDYCLVSEEEIKEAIVLVLKTQHLLIEGASAVALAGFLKNQDTFKNQNVAIILSGANIGLENLTTILDQYENN